MDSNAQLMRRKLAVIEVQGKPGWHIIRELAENTVKAMIDEAINEEDEVRGSNLRREARAARKFLDRFLQAVEITSRAEVPEDVAPAGENYDVACD